ncbi:MAG: cbb3-type cytochrome c oxidase N-terminal domain-containing protein [Bacteroidota bacterium]
MNLSWSIIRIVTFLALAIIGVEVIADTEPGNWELIENPMSWLFVGIVFLLAVAIEIVLHSLNSMIYRVLPEEGKQRFKEKLEQESFSAWISSLNKSKGIEEENEIILDHNYDGIQELDNRLPPWWLYGFYASIIFAVIYMVRFHVWGGYTQDEEYEKEVAIAEKQVEEYLANADDIIDYETVEKLEEESDLAAGEQIYTANCVACHRADGGGSIGPNLTDDHWILGGGIKNVFKTISEGGRPGKGMIAWKSDLSAKEIQQVSSYVLTLQDNNPEDGKEPQGEVWEGEEEQ